MDSDRVRLKAFLEGLEVQHIDALLEQADAATFRKLGQAMAEQMKLGQTMMVRHREWAPTDITGHIIEKETKGE